MNENAAVPDVPAVHVKENADVLDFLLFLRRNKRLVIGLPLACGITAAVLTLAMPDVYKANTNILPPQQPQSGAAALLSQLGGVASAASASVGLKNPNDLYMGMLKSRRINDKIIKRFNLLKVYETASMEEARKELADNTAVSSGKDSLISIEVEDTDRVRAAAMANAFTDELIALTRELAVTEASRRRLFFEREFDTVKNNLAAAEVKLRNGLATGGVISVDSDSKAVVETVGRLRAQIAASEIKVRSLGSFVTSNHHEYQRERAELESMRSQLSKLQNGTPLSASGTSAPEGSRAGLDSIKLLRDLKYNQFLYEILAKQYEAARLEEAKDPSFVQVLDAAVAPEKKVKPKRAIIAVVAGLLGLFIGLGIAFVVHRKKAMLHDPQRAAKLAELGFGVKSREPK